MLKENKEKCFLVFRDIMIAVKLSESESWIKLVTPNYCTCDLWTTLLLGGKTFPIIEAIFFFWFWILAPFNHPRHLESIQYIFPYIKYLPQHSRTPLTSWLSNENSPSLYARGKLSPGNIMGSCKFLEESKITVWWWVGLKSFNLCTGGLGKTQCE